MSEKLKGENCDQMFGELPILIITVHGTWAGSRDPENPKWWEADSEFSSWLCEELADKACTFEEFLWSGANSDRDRSEASRKLVARLRGVDRSKYSKVQIIAHSHGGSVVELALSEINHVSLMAMFKRDLNVPFIDGVVTVGTPYFRTRVSRLTKLGQFGSVMTVPGAILVAVGFIGLYLNPPFGPGSPSDSDLLLLFTILALAFVLCLVTAYSFTLEFLQTTRFGRGIQRVSPQWLAISHKSDEAIYALKTADTETLKLFDARSLRTKILQGVRSVGLLAFASSIPFGILLVALQAVTIGFNAEAIVMFIAPTVIVGISFPIVLLTSFLLLQIVAPLLTRTGDALLNGRIHGFALGQDYLNMLDSVSDTPHSVAADLHHLDGDWHDEMLAKAQESLKEVIVSNHTDLFRRDFGGGLKDILGRVDTDGVFDGLIHTSYFSHRRLAQLIAHSIQEEPYVAKLRT